MKEQSATSKPQAGQNSPQIGQSSPQTGQSSLQTGQNNPQADSRKNWKYADLLDLPHHMSRVHPHMSMTDRAAQFSPFAALTGYEDAVRETARLTDQKLELDENQKALLDEKLEILQMQITGCSRTEAGNRPQTESGQPVSITYFVPDERKQGGEYVTVTGNVRRVDSDGRRIIMEDGTMMELDEIAEISIL